MIKWIYSLLRKKIEHLETEKEWLEYSLVFWPNGSLGFAGRELAIALWDIKIELCKSFLKEGDRALNE